MLQILVSSMNDKQKMIIAVTSLYFLPLKRYIKYF